MAVINRGSIVLVRYPFTDMASAKVRPAVVITPDDYLSRLDDILLLFISSVLPADPLPSDFILDSEHPSFPGTGLKFASVFRAHKLALLHKSLVLRRLGKLDALLTHQLNECLRRALGI